MKTELIECPECHSEVTYMGVGRTLVGYGGYQAPHDHDDNCKFFTWRCKNEHETMERQQNVCPVEGCDWKGKTDCFCSPLGFHTLKVTYSHGDPLERVRKPDRK